MTVLGPNGKLASLRVDADGKLLTTGFAYSGVAAAMPAATAVPPGTQAQLTDLRYSVWVSDGTYWRPAGRQTVVQWQDGWPTPSAVNFSGEYTGATRLAFSQQWNLPAKLWAPGTNLQLHQRARKNGTTSTGFSLFHVRPTQFTSATDTAASWATGSANWAATQIWMSNKSYIYANENSSLVNHSAWFGDTASSPSTAIAEVPGMVLPSAGLWVVPGAALTGGTDSVDLVSVTLEMY